MLFSPLLCSLQHLPQSELTNWSHVYCMNSGVHTVEQVNNECTLAWGRYTPPQSRRRASRFWPWSMILALWALFLDMHGEIISMPDTSLGWQHRTLGVRPPPCLPPLQPVPERDSSLIVQSEHLSDNLADKDIYLQRAWAKQLAE